MENIFYQRLKILSKEHNKSINQIERELGYTRNALANYKNGRVPSGIRLIEISNYFNVIPEYLLGMSSFRNVDNVDNIFLSFNDEQKIEIYLLCQEWIISKIK